MERNIMSGNEAIARGVYEAGCSVAAAYPGTPSTEILENLGTLYKQDVYSQWACNEKVAFEIACGASIGGVRAFCAFKHVGMNVAADPIFSMAYAGVNGGLVFACADDPGCHSSQNEQDNRWYAPHARIGMLEPSSSQECLDYAAAAFDLSEKFDVPVMLRVTTRVCHSKGLVNLGTRREAPPVPYRRQMSKFAMLPAVARMRHPAREAMMEQMEAYANDCPFNRVEQTPSNKLGVVTSGVAYQHAREVFGANADYLKLGLTNPLPRKLMADFCKKYDTLYVIEENDPYLENAVKALGFANALGKERLPVCGELNGGIIRKAFFPGETAPLYEYDTPVPPRAPALCAGCPHRGFFYALSQRLDKVVPAGDIGCYTLGAAAPHNGLDYCICMGAGFSSLIGLSKALAHQGDPRKALGMLGDSTFFHSGITGAIDIVSANANVAACLLNNSITAMTGHQDNPGTAKNLMGEPTPSIDPAAILRATGLDPTRIREVDPLDVAAMGQALDDAIETEGPFFIITRRPCALIKEVARANAGRFCAVDPDKCRGCKKCMKIACPAIAFDGGKARIVDPVNCNGCGLCAALCPFHAIEKRGEAQ